MNTQTWDWIAVSGAVAFAATWLGFYMRRHARKRKESSNSIGACGSSCDGCPFSKGCGGKDF